jgi:hypothetical protein
MPIVTVVGTQNNEDIWRKIAQRLDARFMEHFRERNRNDRGSERKGILSFEFLK